MQSPASNYSHTDLAYLSYVTHPNVSIPLAELVYAKYREIYLII